MDYSKSLDNVRWEKSYLASRKYSKMNFDNDTASGEFYVNDLEENIIYIDFYEVRFFKYYATDYFVKRSGILYEVRIEYSDVKEALSKPPTPKFTTETEKRKVIIPIPPETKIEKLSHEYEDFEKFIKGKEGSKDEIYEIKIYPDGRREENLIRIENEVQPTPNIKQIGTKSIYTYETDTRYEDIPIPKDEEISYSDEKPYGTQDTVIQGSVGRLKKEIKITYKKGIKESEEVTKTTRIKEPTPTKRIKYNGGKVISTRTEREKVIVPAPKEVLKKTNENWYTDEKKTTEAKDGYYFNVYEIQTITDGQRQWENKVLKQSRVDEVLPIQATETRGIKPIERFETTYEYEEIPIPSKPRIVIDKTKYANLPDETIFHGEKGKITREYRNRYYKDQFKDRELVKTTRVEAKQKKIRRGTKPYITRTETGRDKKVIPIPKEPQINKRNDQWEDYNVKVSDGKEGSYYEEWRINYYSDGNRKKVITNPKANLVEAKPIIIDKGIKPINWIKTREETILDEELKEEIIFDNEKYEDEEDEILVHGTFGKTIKTITEYYKKDDKKREEVTGTRRVEGNPKRIRRGKKRGEYLWRRLRVEYLDGKIEYIDVTLVLDKELDTIRQSFESYREQTDKEIKEFVKQTDFDLNNNKVDEKINQISRTATETKEIIRREKEWLEQQISKTASEYKRDIQNAKDGLSSQIKQSADEYSRTLTVTKQTLEKNINEAKSELKDELQPEIRQISSKFEQKADSFELSIREIRKDVKDKVSDSDVERKLSTFKIGPENIDLYSKNILLSTLGGITSSEAERISKQNAGISKEEATRLFSSLELTQDQIRMVTQKLKLESVYGGHKTIMEDGTLKTYNNNKIKIKIDGTGLRVYDDYGSIAGTVRMTNFRNSKQPTLGILHDRDYSIGFFYDTGYGDTKPYLIMDKTGKSGYLQDTLYPIEFREGVNFREPIRLSARGEIRTTSNTGIMGTTNPALGGECTFMGNRGSMNGIYVGRDGVPYIRKDGIFKQILTR